MDQIRKQILIVEDEETVIHSLRHHVEKAGFDAVIAHGGKEALDLIRKELPDLVLLDIIMPGMSGFEVCRQLRADERTKNLPIIMVTGFSGETGSQSSLMDGASAVLLKPVSEEVLINKILSFLKSPFK